MRVNSSSSNKQDISKNVWCAFIISDIKDTIYVNLLVACGVLQLQIIISAAIGLKFTLPLLHD